MTSQTLSHVAIVTLTGMVPETVSEEAKSVMLDPLIMAEQAGWA